MRLKAIMSRQDCIIRPAIPSDVSQMVALLQDLFLIETDFTFNQSKQQAGLLKLLEQPSAIVLVAEIGGRVAGMCTVQTIISTAEGCPSGLLEDMVVSEAFRGRGVGRILLEAAEDWALSKGFSRLQLLADSRNLPAQGFYRACDWQRTNMVCLRRNLGSAGLAGSPKNLS